MARPSCRLTGCALAIAAVTAGYAPMAKAQNPVETQRAEQLFIEASVLAQRQDFAAACPKFEESQRLDPAVGTRFNLALCYEKIGRLGSAWHHLRAVSHLAHETGKKGREDAARQKLDELRPRVVHLVIAATDADATLKVDGEPVEREEWSFYAVDPGEHTLDAAAPAKKPWRLRIVPAQGVLELAVHVPALELLPGQTRVVTVTRETSDTPRTLGFALGGLGILGLGTAVATGLVLLDTKATADRKCTPTCIDQDGRDAVSRGKTLLPINAIAWGIGVVALGVGSFLVLKPRASKVQARVEPLVGPTAAGASVVGVF